MSRLELAGRVRDVCAGILFRQGKQEAARALFWQPAPLLLRAATNAAKPRERKTVNGMDRRAGELLAALRKMEARP